MPITVRIQMIFYYLVKYFNTRHTQASRYVQENLNYFFTPHVVIKIAEDQVKANQHTVTAFNLQRVIYELLTRRASTGLKDGGNSQYDQVTENIFIKSGASIDIFMHAF